jgi:hypothetical protein
MPSSNDHDFFSLKASLVGIAVVTLLVLALVSAGWWWNTMRANQIIQTYGEEFLNHQMSRPETFETFYNETFEACEAVRRAKGDGTYQIDCAAAQAQLNLMAVDKLKDSSAMTYVKVVDNKYMVIDASGDYKRPEALNSWYSGRWGSNEDGELEEFFTSENPDPIYADVTYMLPGREVVLPVRDRQGKVIGFVIRSVLER